MRHPFFSIITPTLQRESLVDLCKSIDAQTFTEWEHIIIADSDVLNEDLAGRIAHRQRKFFVRDFPHAEGHAANKIRNKLQAITAFTLMTTTTTPTRMFLRRSTTSYSGKACRWSLFSRSFVSAASSCRRASRVYVTWIRPTLWLRARLVSGRTSRNTQATESSSRALCRSTSTRHFRPSTQSLSCRSSAEGGKNESSSDCRPQLHRVDASMR